MTDKPVFKIWTRAGFIDDELSPEKGAVFFSPEEITGKIGSGLSNVLVLDAGDEAGAAAGRLNEIDAIFVNFPAFSDGRGFSTARLLREKYGFAGIIRATGHFILDQIPFLLRVGVDQFAVSHEPTLERLARNALPEVTLYLQPAFALEEKAGERAWARRRNSE
jgi:uncharacterized protein (DUF934 family)